MARILYLEDEAWQVEGTVILFMEKELGHSVARVSSVGEAKIALSRNTYDVILLDVMLNTTKGRIQFEDSGLMIAQLVLENEFAGQGNPKTLPIVIASGVWDATIENAHGADLTVEDMARTLGIPDHCFLRKPFLADEVQKVLDQVLTRDGEA